MAVSLTHTTAATGTDSGDGKISKNAWNEAHTLTMATDRLLGRTTAGAGAVEELTAAGVKTFLGANTHDIWIPAGSMLPRITSGAAWGSAETSTNKNNRLTLDFASDATEYAQFFWRMPKSWNESTVTFIPIWSHPATVTNFGVVWELSGVAISNDDTLEVAQGTVQSSTDTGGTTDDLYAGPESSAITIGGTPAEGDYVVFEISRDYADASDTMAVDARLHGIVLRIVTNTLTDA